MEDKKVGLLRGLGLFFTPLKIFTPIFFSEKFEVIAFIKQSMVKNKPWMEEIHLIKKFSQ